LFFEKPILDKEKYFDYSFTRQGQDVRYSIDSTKLNNLGWSANKNFEEELKVIVDYYRNNFIW
jgi:dTDP-D-glucose 4,6-dehydratase